MWKHPNLRVAYVAQHAFHHVEQHLDMTPNEYIRWRYAFGEDREEQDKVGRNGVVAISCTAELCVHAPLTGWSR